MVDVLSIVPTSHNGTLENSLKLNFFQILSLASLDHPARCAPQNAFGVISIDL